MKLSVLPPIVELPTKTPKQELRQKECATRIIFRNMHRASAPLGHDRLINLRVAAYSSR